jgi:Short-chain dehydrogenases of various substrate specificities
MHIALTGATGGLGMAIACAYAGPGVRLSLSGRDENALVRVAGACREKGALVHTARFDIRDGDALREWLARADATDPLTLVFANAGVSATAREERLEHPEDADRLFDINAKSAMRTASVAAECMARRGSGAIVVMSSMAGLQKLPYSPAYSASKAAARYYGLALRGWLAPKGVRVTVVCPGYVDTPMSDRLESPKPFLWSPEKAALHIKRKLLRNPRQIVFPWPLALGIWLESLLPGRFQEFFQRRFSFHVKPDKDSPERSAQS